MAAQCAADGVDHPEYLLRLAELELIDRRQRMVERRIRAARFPAVKSLDTLDFPAIPSMNKALVMELARCEYIQEAGQRHHPSATSAGVSILPLDGPVAGPFQMPDKLVIRHLWRPFQGCSLGMGVGGVSGPIPGAASNLEEPGTPASDPPAQAWERPE